VRALSSTLFRSRPTVVPPAGPQLGPQLKKPQLL
jgi:hypothetical protein